MRTNLCSIIESFINSVVEDETTINPEEEARMLLRRKNTDLKHASNRITSTLKDLNAPKEARTGKIPVNQTPEAIGRLTYRSEEEKSRTSDEHNELLSKIKKEQQKRQSTGKEPSYLLPASQGK